MKEFFFEFLILSSSEQWDAENCEFELHAGKIVGWNWTEMLQIENIEQKTFPGFEAIMRLRHLIGHFSLL